MTLNQMKLHHLCDLIAHITDKSKEKFSQFMLQNSLGNMTWKHDTSFQECKCLYIKFSNIKFQNIAVYI